jgi:hypothetical protein
MGLRRGLANEGRRLLQRGARRSQVWLAAGGEITAVTLAGVVAGAVGGAIVVALVARAAGLPAALVLEHSAVTLTGLGVVAAVAVVATATVLVGARARDEETPSRRIRLLDVAAVGAAAAAALGLARGGLDPQDLTSGSSRTLLLALPVLVSFVAAVLAVRLLRPLTRAGERMTRNGPLRLRLALLALSRAPVRTAATAAFLLVSLGLALFAAGWRSTLERGAEDQAAFAVPLDFTLGEGARLVLPQEAASVAQYDALAPDVHAYPVLRSNASVAGLGASVLNPTVLGVPPLAVRRLSWRSDFSSFRPDELADRLGAGGTSTPNGLGLPAGASELALTAHLRGVAVRLDLIVRDGAGRTFLLLLGEKGQGPGPGRARAPPTVRQVVGLEVSLATAEQLGFSHRETGGEETGPEAGSARLEPLRVTNAAGGSRAVTSWRGFVTRAGLRQAPSPGAVSLSYAFTEGQSMLLRLPQPTDGRALPVVVSPDVARSASDDGSLLLDFQGVRVPARVAAVARRFPAAGDQDQGFVIADEGRLATALDADSPGTGTPGELWLDVPSRSVATVAAALRQPPYASLAVSSRRDLLHDLATDPLARAISVSLAATALVALALAVAGFWIALLSELRDERGELFDLEAQGVAPEVLRAQFRVRAAALLAAGIAGGCALGLFLSRLVVSVVRVSASTAPPDPPLRLETPWLVIVVGLAAVALLLAAALELTTRRAFRADAPERASWSLE